MKSAGGTDPELSKGMVALLETLHLPETPSVSIEVADKSVTSPPDKQPMAKGLRSMIGDGLGKTLGKDMIVFVSKPEDKPALIDVKYQTAGDGTATWWVEIRMNPDDAKPFVTKSGRVSYPLASADSPASNSRTWAVPSPPTTRRWRARLPTRSPTRSTVT